MTGTARFFAFAPALIFGAESTRSSRPSRDAAAFWNFQVRAEPDATLVIIAVPRGGEPTMRGLADLFTPAP